MYFFADLLLRMRNMKLSEVVRPAEPLQVDDVLIGTVDDQEEIKRMYYLFYASNENASSLQLIHEMVCPPNETTQAMHDDMRIKYLMAKQESIVIATNIKHLLRRRFPQQLADKQKIYLRENWQVVYTDSWLPV